MISKRLRTYTEKTTSVEQPIEVVQYGQIQQYHPALGAASDVIIIPTNIPTVKSVQLTPLNATAAKYIGLGVYFEKDMYSGMISKRYATNAYVSRTLNTATGTKPGRAVLSGRNLHVFASDKFASTSAQALAYVRGGSKASEGRAYNVVKHHEDFGSNAKNYVIGYVASTTGATAKYYEFGYEVRGYE